MIPLLYQLSYTATQVRQQVGKIQNYAVIVKKNRLTP